MDDLLREFLTETGEHLDTVDVELVRFEQDPNNESILRNIFRLVHTIKGTCGFLGLSRLEALAHAAETLMGKFRDGMPVTSDAVTLILATLDRVKEILAELERKGVEPEGSDPDLITALEEMADQEPGPVTEDSAAAAEPMPVQSLERPLEPREVSLDELERAFREAPGPDDIAAAEPELPIAARPNSDPKPDIADHPESVDQTQGKNQTIRVTVGTLEHLMTMVSELVLTRNQLLEIARRVDDPAYKAPLQRLSHVTAELQEGVMKTRMQPIGSAWQKLPRIVRDLSGELSKKLELVLQGGDTELDRQVLDIIKDPLTHMIRNSADHGIETPQERKAAGKPEHGTIRLNAYHEGGTITIEIADDGRGLDHRAIRRKAIERGLAPKAEIERMSDAQVARFIFHPGFSTATAVTSVSGRGVGMDVVKTNIELIGGTIEIRSEQGRGTTFTIKIPLTLAIVAALIVSVQNQRFAIPQVAVLELVRVSPGSDNAIERVNGTPILRLRDRLLPIVPLSAVLGLAAEQEDEGYVVATQVGGQRFGILVDTVFHTEEIVVKPMNSKLRHIPLFSGNTILGDGAVVLIIDPNGIARKVGSDSSDREFRADDALDEPVEQSGETETLLVFRGTGSALKAIPLSLVSRLEEVDATAVEWLGERPYLQYRGRLMPLVPADENLAVKREGMQAIIVFADGERSMGLTVEEIVDIVDDSLDIELVAGRPDLVGSSVVRGRATEIVNLAHFLPLAHDDWMRPSSRAAASARSVLLVDDSDFFRDMLVPVLKASGYRVHPASSADHALQLISRGLQPDVLVTDLDMPERDGFHLVESLRADPRFSDLPVIALASGVSRDTVQHGHKLNVTEFVAKFDRSGLLSALAAAQDAFGESA
ncbi:hybrid sensor histidine kinase/response regulator [Microvirga massiliensis]|uniref:hybrid sensor histidine kinase/response regulator n=1 Tax=Microvirga massiliensis TaxID=1033741 RepID=UPI00062B9DAF|nr:hybrid sensor histidine kinase/response regulator [Microvirga massiliensis]